MNTAQAIVHTLKLQGIGRLFCLPGIQNDPFFDALYDEKDAIRPIHTRHEQGSAYMALGAALATGEPQVYCVVPGPGFLNTTAALSTAYACNAKVLALSGQIPSAYLGKELGFLHEIPDQLGIIERLSKWAGRIDDPETAAQQVQQAFRQLLNGRPRPVGLECPMDVWKKEVNTALPQTPVGIEAAAIDDDALQQAAILLGKAEKPMIVVGGGAQDASAEVRAIAEMLQAPVCAVRTGHGIVDSRHYLSVTAPGGNALWRDADAVLAIGTRLQAQQMAWGLDERIKIIRIDADPAQLDRINEPAIGIVADAGTALRRLLDLLPAHNKNRPSRKEELETLKAATAERFQTLGPQLSYLEAIRAELPENGIFVDELTQLGYVARFAFPVYHPRTFLTTAYQGTLGWGFAAALGAKLATPDKPVVSVCGDGGFMFNVQELATAVRHNIAVVVIVMNDGAYGNVRRIQKQMFDNRTIASDLVNPDFVKLAESFGVMGLKAQTPAELKQALRQAFAANAPVLIEVPCGEMPDPWAFFMLPRVRGEKRGH